MLLVLTFRNVLFNNYKFTLLPAMFILSHGCPTRFVHTGGSSGVKVSEATQESRQQKEIVRALEHFHAL